MDSPLIESAPAALPTIPVVGPTPVTPESSGQTAEILPNLPTSLQQSSLPQKYHDAFALKLSGKSMEELATRFGVDRTTIWRWCSAVEREFADNLEQVPTFNMLALEVKRLLVMEERNLQDAETASSPRARAMSRANALKCAQARIKLLLDVGIFERAPEKLFKVVATMKPADQTGSGQSPGTERTREQLIESLIEKLGRSQKL